MSDLDKLLEDFMDIDDDPRNVFLRNPEKVPEPPRSRIQLAIDELKKKLFGDDDD